MVDWELLSSEKWAVPAVLQFSLEWLGWFTTNITRVYMELYETCPSSIGLISKDNQTNWGKATLYWERWCWGGLESYFWRLKAALSQDEAYPPNKMS